MSQTHKTGLEAPEGLTIESIGTSDGLITVSQGNPDSHRQRPSAKQHRRPATVELHAVKLS